MATRNLFLTTASLAVVLLLLLIGAAAIILLFTVGSPLVLFGGILAIGLAGIILLIGIVGALICVWYVIYAFLNEYLGGKGADAPPKGNYTLERIKKSK